MIDWLNADRLRDATADDPMVRAVVLGGRIADGAWAGYGAYVWEGTHRGEPSIVGIGSAAGAARLATAIVRDRNDLRHASLPRGWLEHTAPGRFARKADWDWFWTDKAPDLLAGQAAWLTPRDEPDVRALLEQAMPDAAAWPGDDRVRRWAGIRDGELQLVACAADTSRSRAVGHMSSVVTATGARRTGYGATLVGWMTGQYLDEGAELVTLGMYADNEAARRLYGRLGFTCQHRFTSAGVRTARTRNSA